MRIKEEQCEQICNALLKAGCEEAEYSYDVFNDYVKFFIRRGAAFSLGYTIWGTDVRDVAEDIVGNVFRERFIIDFKEVRKW